MFSSFTGSFSFGRRRVITPEFSNPTPTSTGAGVSVVAESPFAGGGNSYLFNGRS